MTTRLDGKFFTTQKMESWGDTTYCIRMTTDRQLHMSFERDSISFTGFMLEEERDRYLAEWTDAELEQVRGWIHEMYGTEDLKTKKRLSTLIYKLKDAVQKRAGIRDT